VKLKWGDGRAWFDDVCDDVQMKAVTMVVGIMFEIPAVLNAAAFIGSGACVSAAEQNFNEHGGFLVTRPSRIRNQQSRARFHSFIIIIIIITIIIIIIIIVIVIIIV
jgi:hypothetical protein